MAKDLVLCRRNREELLQNHSAHPNEGAAPGGQAFHENRGKASGADGLGEGLGIAFIAKFFVIFHKDAPGRSFES